MTPMIRSELGRRAASRWALTQISSCFLKWRVSVYFIFLSDGKAPKRRAARGNLPLPFTLLSTGLKVCLNILLASMGPCLGPTTCDACKTE